MIARALGVLGLLVVASVPVRASTSVAPIAAVHVPVDRAALDAVIANARREAPATFTAVANVKAQLPRLDAHKRGPLAHVAPLLRALGPAAVPAMIDALDHEDATFTATARRALRIGLVEAIGLHRDERARTLLVSLLDDRDDLVVRAAAEGIGRFADDAAIRVLSSRLDNDAVVSGAGTCRRRAMASALAAAHPSRALVRALGELGSSWAWRANVPAKSEESDVRAIAADALVRAFVADPALRRDASNALMVVDDPSTPARIAAAKSGASSDTIAALDRLLERFARNPAR